MYERQQKTSLDPKASVTAGQNYYIIYANYSVLHYCCNLILSTTLPFLLSPTTNQTIHVWNPEYVT